MAFRVPQQVIEKDVLELRFWLHLVDKYEDHLSIHRELSGLKENNVLISSSWKAGPDRTLKW